MSSSSPPPLEPLTVSSNEMEKVVEPKPTNGFLGQIMAESETAKSMFSDLEQNDLEELNAFLKKIASKRENAQKSCSAFTSRSLSPDPCKQTTSSLEEGPDFTQPKKKRKMSSLKRGQK